jgi:DNA-binding transcriptional regulator YdaS (Cro superfamily)
MTSKNDALQKAVELFKNPTRLAAAIGYSQHAVWSAMKRGQVSPKMAIAIHRATRGKIKKDHLRPDIFGDAA